MKKSLEQAALEMAQSTLETMRGGEGGHLTRDTIVDVVDQVLGLPYLKSISKDERNQLVRELEARYDVWIGAPAVLVDNDGHEAWLTPERRKGGRLWARYRRYLERGWSTVAVDALDDSTGRILGMLEDPRRSGQWDRRGMVVGHVQSGKTSSYTGLICKAVDSGYKVIIVLAGLHNNLRSQTQMRLDEGFLGYETEEREVAGKKSVHRIGVGDIDPDPGIKLDYVTTRHDKGDFTLARGKNFGINPGGNPLLFVVKKNVSVLRNLHKWIDRSLRGGELIADVPLLVIDDEADHASVDTREQAFDEGRPDEDHDPTSINKAIRQILRKFAKSSYVGYTATPFANIYIHDRGETAAEGPDLFPRSFIINLPAPSNYDGPVRIFGLEQSDDQPSVPSLPLVRIIEDQDCPAAWMPLGHPNGHRPRHEGMDALPPSLMEAVRAFVLVCAARRARGHVNVHNSMLIHVTRFTSVQKAVRKQIEAAFKSIQKQLRYDGSAKSSELAVLEALWIKDFESTSASVGLLLPERKALALTWSMVAACIANTVESIQIKTINGKAEDILDYDTHKSVGLNVIAIGGDKLARGLTLEGLSVSYFLRASTMYDTLMQMGRWFGYRPGYLDLCRLYMTHDLRDWFCHITEASEELRREFDLMALLQQTPKDYGLKVKSHPEMLVTSRVKMRNGTEVDINFSGSSSETVVLPRSIEVLRNNIDATSELIDLLGPPTESDPVRRRGQRNHQWEGGHLWTGVPAKAIIEFLRSYKTHRESHRVNALQLAEFVSRKNERKELTSWTVAILSGDPGSPWQIGALRGDMIKRGVRTRVTVDEQVARGVYLIGRLLAPRDEAIDLDEKGFAEALNGTIASWPRDAARSDSKIPPTTPSGLAIRTVRGRHHPERGLLLLYPLDPAVPGIDFNGPIMAFCASFPSGGEQVLVKYTVNNVFWEQEYTGDA
jgi:hypothetical protein